MIAIGSQTLRTNPELGRTLTKAGRTIASSSDYLRPLRCHVPDKIRGKKICKQTPLELDLMIKSWSSLLIEKRKIIRTSTKIKPYIRNTVINIRKLKQNKGFQI